MWGLEWKAWSRAIPALPFPHAGPESWKTLGLINFPGVRIAAILLTHFHSDHIGDLGEFRMQTWVGGRRRPLPVYGPTGEIFPLAPDRGHRLLFRFHSNDLGKARFDHLPLTINDNGLVMQRYDSQIRFIRVQP